MHAILFDIDGTLIHTGGAGTAALRAAMTTAFGVDNPTDSVSVTGRTDRAITRDLLEFHGIADSLENWERFRAAYLTHLPRNLGAFQGRVLPGIATLLTHLRQRDGILLGLLTGNTRDGARLKLSHYKLNEHFAFGGFGDHHFSRDDVAREALREVTSRRSGPVDPQGVWVVGDTPLDVQCARAIGAKVLAVATGSHRHDQLEAAQPDALFADLSRVEDVLRILA